MLRSRKQEVRSPALIKPQVVPGRRQQPPAAVGVPAPHSPRRDNYVNTNNTRGAGTRSSDPLVRALLLHANAAARGYGVSRPGVWKRGPRAPALPPCSTPQTDFPPASLLTPSAPAGARRGRRPPPRCRSPAEAHGQETRAARRRESLRFQGKGVPGNTHPSASRVSRTSPSIVGSGPNSGPLMVLRPKAVRRSKKPAGNLRHGAKVPGGVSVRTVE